jgi:hypothetical protein
MKAFLRRLATTTIIALLAMDARSLADVPYSFSDRPSQDGRCIGDHGVGEVDRSEEACLAQIGETAQRIGSGLQLKFKNGNTRVYLNEETKCQASEAEGCVKYKLTGYFPEHDLMLIEVGYWEGVSWRLVRADTGNSIEIVAPPHYSPDRRWLASVASSEGPAGPPNGMDLIPTSSDPSLKEWHYRTPVDGQWLYSFAGWEGSTRVKLLASSLRAPHRSIPTTIERNKSGWYLREHQ